VRGKSQAIVNNYLYDVDKTVKTYKLFALFLFIFTTTSKTTKSNPRRGADCLKE
jgi:hypothetical protein